MQGLDLTGGGLRNGDSCPDLGLEQVGTDPLPRPSDGKFKDVPLVTSPPSPLQSKRCGGCSQVRREGMLTEQEKGEAP